MKSSSKIERIHLGPRSRDKSKKDETLIIATHGILKKTQKTPPKEIRKVEEIRKRI